MSNKNLLKVLSALLFCISTQLTAQAVYPGQDYLLRAAKQIDGMVNLNLKRKGQKPNPLAPDHVFVKRAYLGIVGRIPTYDEVRAYLDSDDEYKKLKLIWKLMDSPGYDSTQFNYWADLLRLNDTQPGGGNARDGGTPYIEWVREQIRHNTPYDEFVTQLLTASGDMWSHVDGASGFYRRDYGMGLDHFALTMQVFSGIQMQCAQCHNHPFEKWTQKQFFEMAAFFKLPRQEYNPELNYDFKEVNKGLMKRLNEKEMQYFRRYMRRQFDWNSGQYIPKEGDGYINLPHNFIYKKDGSPNQRIQPKTAFGKEIKFSPSKMKEGPRTVFAEWLTSPTHPYFTRVIANRLWKKTMGIGFFEPVDDVRPDTKASNDQLLKFLEKQMVYYKYDLKVFLAMLYSTDLFQRESTTYEYSDLKAYHFPGPVIVRMTAEQIWDSLMTLKVSNFDSYVRPPVLGRYQEHSSLMAMSQDEIIDFIALHAKGMSPESKGYSSGMGESLRTGKIAKKGGNQSGSMMGGMSMQSMNGRGKSRSVPAAFTKLSQNAAGLKTFQEGTDLLWKFETERDYKKIKSVKETIYKKGLQYGLSEGESNVVIRHMLSTRKDARSSPYVRASELGSPAPAGHLLRVFGASDRIYLGNDSSKPNAPQSLELMNGFVYDKIIGDLDSVINKTLNEGSSLEDKIDRLYLSAYCRPPTSEEMAEMKALVENSVRGDMDGAIWTVLNSLEFLFVL